MFAKILSFIERKLFIFLLDRMPRPYPLDVFYALCRNTIMLPIEIIPLTRSGKVLMFRRPDDDPFYPRLWHTPGGVQIKGQSPEDVLERLLERDELRGTGHSHPEFLFNGTNMHGRGPREALRGQEEARVYFVWIREDEYTGSGTFFSLNTIPSDTFGPHKGFLEKIRNTFDILPR